jgi:FixJ family two-component response regulator
MAIVLLLDLETSLAEQLSSVLEQLGQRVYAKALDTGMLEETDANLVFARPQDLVAILKTRSDLPVVVVSRMPEVSAWLDALEQGAADYCGAPFEATQVRWVLNTSLAPAHRLAA